VGLAARRGVPDTTSQFVREDISVIVSSAGTTTLKERVSVYSPAVSDTDAVSFTTCSSSVGVTVALYPLLPT